MLGSATLWNITGMLRSHGMKAATRTYTPGKLAKAQPSPKEVRPMSTGFPSGAYWINGPPLSPELFDAAKR